MNSAARRHRQGPPRGALRAIKAMHAVLVLHRGVHGVRPLRWVRQTIGSRGDRRRSTAGISMQRLAWPVPTVPGA